MLSVVCATQKKWYRDVRTTIVKGHKNMTFRRDVRTWYKIRPLVLKAWKSSYSLPPEKTYLSACHALHTARIVPEPRPVSASRLDYLAFSRKVFVRRGIFEKVRKFTNVSINIATRKTTRAARTCQKKGRQAGRQEFHISCTCG